MCIVEFNQPEIPVEVGDLIEICFPKFKEPLELLVFNTDDQVRTIVKELDYESKAEETTPVSEGKVRG